MRTIITLFVILFILLMGIVLCFKGSYITREAKGHLGLLLLLNGSLRRVV